MERRLYNEIKENSDKTEEVTNQYVQELCENLTILVESLTKFIRFIDQKIEIKREYYFDSNKRVYKPELDYYYNPGILLYANITDYHQPRKIPNDKDEMEEVIVYSGEMYYLIRSGYIVKFDRSPSRRTVQAYLSNHTYQIPKQGNRPATKTITSLPIEKAKQLLNSAFPILCPL